MAATVSTYNGTFADMAAIETEFQANWADLEYIKGPRRAQLYVRTSLAVGQKLRLFTRAAGHDGTPIWSLHPDGEVTITSAMRQTTAGDEWVWLRYQVGEDWSGFVVSTDAAASVLLTTTDLP